MLPCQVYHCVDESGAVRAAFKLVLHPDGKAHPVFVRVDDTIFFSEVRANLSSSPAAVAVALNDWLRANAWCRANVSGAWDEGEEIAVISREGGLI